MSSQKNQSSILQPSAVNCREINGSVASLNNSSMINSSRNQIAKSLHPVKSFADIADPPEEMSHKRRVSGQAVPVNHRISIQSQIYATQGADERLKELGEFDIAFKTDRAEPTP